MINPYLIIGLLVAWMGSVAYSYHIGGVHTENALKAQHADQLKAVIAQHNENTVVDMQAAVEAESERQQTRIEYRDRVQEITRLIHEDPTDCHMPEPVRVRINAAIDAANSAVSTQPGVMPTPAKAGDGKR